MNTSDIHGFVSFTVIQNVECYFPFPNILGPNSINAYIFSPHCKKLIIKTHQGWFHLQRMHIAVTLLEFLSVLKLKNKRKF